MGIEHEVVTYDPLQVFGEGGALSESGAEVQKPTFFYGKDPPLPDGAAQMRDTIKVLGFGSLLSVLRGSCQTPNEQDCH